MAGTPWILKMQWRDVLFAHWPVASSTLLAFLPRRVPLDTFDGQAWLSLVALGADTRPRGVPFGLRFAQVNLRTYVRVNGTAGIWTFSLDAGNALASSAAHLAYALPYYPATAHLLPPGRSLRPSSFEFQSVRRADRHYTCRAFYRPEGTAAPALLGSLDHWLAERRSLFTVGWDGSLWRADVRHEPWPLQSVTLELQANTLPAQLGLHPGQPAAAHYARVVHARLWPPRRQVVP